MRKILILLGSILALLASFYIVTEFIYSKNFTNIRFSKNSKQLIPTPTPMPYEDLTIPSLQKRKYESELGPLMMAESKSNYISYSANYLSDGLKINGQLTIPKGDMPLEGWPGIIFVHGYIPPSIYDTFSNYEAYVDYLANKGFVVFKIDLRGHAQSEGEASGAYFSPDYVIDTLNARKALQSSDFVNPDKIGLWGHSMAGNVVTRAWAVDPTIRAVVVWAGAVYTYSDMQKYGISDNSYRPPSDQSRTRMRRNELFKIYGQFDPKNIFWSRVPMVNYLTNLNGIIQIHHAVDDDVVNIGYSRDFVNILIENNVRNQLFEYNSGGHNINGESFNLAMKRTSEFFEKNL